MPPKGTKVRDCPSWWRYVVLDLWLELDRPSAYQSTAVGGFHRKALDLISSAYAGMADAPKAFAFHCHCRDLSHVY